MPLWQIAKRSGIDIAEVAAAVGGCVVIPAQALDDVAQAMGLELGLVPATPFPRQVGPVRSLVDDAIERLAPGQAVSPPDTADITVLALGFEGTLILDTASPVARPGLMEFLQCARGLFSRIAVFTALPEAEFRRVARLLEAEGEAPDWFGNAEYVHWRGPDKDLRCILEASPQQTLLVESDIEQVHPSQLDRWVQVETFEPSTEPSEVELPRVLQLLVDRVVAQEQVRP